MGDSGAVPLVVSYMMMLQEAEKKDPALLAVEDIKEQCRFIRRSVETKEPRYSS